MRKKIITKKTCKRLKIENEEEVSCGMGKEKEKNEGKVELN
jgi:hypothetical protein